MQLRLREIRLLKKLNATEIAQRVGVTPASYYRYEKGEQTLSAEMLYKLAKALGVSADYIIGLTDVEEDKAKERTEESVNLKEVKSITWGSFPMDKEDIEELKKYAEFIIWKKIRT